jgi:hypothetical protein
VADTEQFKFQRAVAAAVAGKRADLIALLLADYPMTASDKNALAYLLSGAHKRRRGAQPARLHGRTYNVRRAAAAVRQLGIPVEQALMVLAPWWPSHGYKLDPESEADMDAVRNALRRSRKPPKRRKSRGK